jgi:hypothetical protein
MPASTFISKYFSTAGVTLLLLLRATSAHAGSDTTFGQQNQNPQEDDFKSSPYMQYGEFNEEKEEEEDAQFFQFGRFFGVSLGLGYETADGNRGAIWRGGFPLVDFKLHYWFNFNFALDLDFSYVNQNYSNGSSGSVTGTTNLNLIHGGVDLKYYFDTKNIAAPIAFANPYLVLGIGEYSLTESSGDITQNTSSTNSNSFGVNAGAGFEFAVKPRKTYFTVEGKIHFVKFDSDNTDNFVPALQDSSGNLYTFVAGFLFTW